MSWPMMGGWYTDDALVHGFGALRLNCCTIGWVDPDAPQSKNLILPVSVASTIRALNNKNEHVDVTRSKGCEGNFTIMSIEYSMAG